MKKSILNGALFVAFAGLLMSLDLPRGWFPAGSEKESYEMGMDPGAGRDGKNAATIKSIKKNIKGFGTLMQKSSAEKYLGKRIKMSAFVKSKEVANWAGLWLRVDQAGSKEPLSFDNMSTRPIKGNTEWKNYEIILDVPPDASQLIYGALLNGTGQIWFDNLAFEIVADTVPVTGTINNKKIVKPVEPDNLDFED
jgi:hypothetical protein